MESSKTSRYERASKAVGGSIMKLGGSFKKRSRAKKPTLKSSSRYLYLYLANAADLVIRDHFSAGLDPRLG